MTGRAHGIGRVHLTVALASSLTAALTACGTTEPPPNLSLNGPTAIAEGRVCLVGAAAPRQRVAASRCDAGEFEGEVFRVLEFGYISNQLGDSVAVVDFNQRLPELIDTRDDIPGTTHIPVGRRPAEIAISDDGNFVFTFNQLDLDISVIGTDLRREVARIPVGLPIAAMILAPSSASAEAQSLWLLTPEPARLIEIPWSATCDGGDTFLEGCQPEIQAEARTALELPGGSLPRYAVLGPTRDSIFVTFGRDPNLTEILLAEGRVEEDTRACQDGGAAPCVARRVGLTFGCLDGIDNDGDGLIDAQDPQCLGPDGSEAADGVRRARASACDDGLDNDGDGLIDAQDPGCTFAGDGSETGAALAVACSDGLDNDGDGLVDADDPECALGPWFNSEAALPACSDGEDNDGDGLADDEDPQCTSPLQDNEQRRPACSDANDNDGDGLVDDDDPDCVSPLSDNEGPTSTACNDGIDNDLDGAVDLEDPGCNGPDGGSELDTARPCADGVDNDGDGLVDYPADPDCYGVAGRGEEGAPVFEFGPLAIDPEGLFAYVVDRRTPQILIVDLRTGRLMDPNNCGDGRDDCRPRLADTRVGLPVGRLPTAITARHLEIFNQDSPDGRFRITRTLATANVATSRGSVFFANAARITRVFDNGELIDQVIEPELRLNDSVASQASATQPLCDLDGRTLDLLSLARGRNVSRFEVDCDEPELPRITPPATDCIVDEDLGCVCEGEGDGQVCFIERAGQGPVEVLSRQRAVAEFNTAGEPEFSTETISDDFYIPDDSWKVIYEGTYASRSDVVVDDLFEGVIRSNGGTFCDSDVRPGDILTITAPVTPLATDGESPECDAFRGVDLSYKVATVSANHLTLATLTPEDYARLDRQEDQTPVQALPARECFAAGLSVSLSVVDQWVVLGERSGFLSNQTSAGSVCVPRFDVQDQNARLNTGDTFLNPFFSFRLVGGAFEPPQDYTLSFTTSSRFTASILTVGPSSTDIAQIQTARGSYLPVLDAGTNVVRVFDAGNNRLLAVLF